jgi:hypothetical protein
MSGVQVTSLLGVDCVQQWGELLQPQALIAMAPGVLCGVGMLLMLQRFNHFLVLPAMLLSIPALFFAIAFGTGSDMQQLRDDG